MVCYYCGAPFSIKTINKKCEKNAKIPPKECNFFKKLMFFALTIEIIKVIGFTKKTPYIKYHGLLQHFFAFPNEMIMRNVKSLFSLQENLENLEKTEKKTFENEKKNLRTFIGMHI